MILNSKAKKVAACFLEVLMIGAIVMLISGVVEYITFHFAKYWFMRSLSVESFLEIVFDGGFTAAVLIIIVEFSTRAMRRKVRAAVLESV